MGEACSTHGRMRIGCNISVRKTVEKRLLARRVNIWEDNIKMDIKETFGLHMWR
jgi:hypothetical protein